jgi:hypothetical protein
MMEEDIRDGSTKFVFYLCRIAPQPNSEFPDLLYLFRMEFDFTATKKITLILKFVFAIHSSPDQVLSKTSFGFCGTPAPP